VHDYFDLLGLSDGARASEIRRRSASRPRRWHPDFGGGGASMKRPRLESLPRSDAAVDFVSMAGLVDRIQQAFFTRI
jgi:hypothetical protein